MKFALKFIQLLRNMHKENFPQYGGCEYFVMHKQLFVPDAELKKTNIPYLWVSLYFIHNT